MVSSETRTVFLADACLMERAFCVLSPLGWRAVMLCHQRPCSACTNFVALSVRDIDAAASLANGLNVLLCLQRRCHWCDIGSVDARLLPPPQQVSEMTTPMRPGEKGPAQSKLASGLILALAIKPCRTASPSVPSFKTAAGLRHVLRPSSHTDTVGWPWFWY